jgi:hypothetical protein
MFCKKLCCNITIHVVTINFQSCIPHSVILCICISFPLRITAICRFIFLLFTQKQAQQMELRRRPQNKVLTYLKLCVFQQEGPEFLYLELDM